MPPGLVIPPQHHLLHHRRRSIENKFGDLAGVGADGLSDVRIVGNFLRHNTFGVHAANPRPHSVTRVPAAEPLRASLAR
jgi:hypothetical protein